MKFNKLCHLENIDLHVHTRYSHDATIHPKKLAAFANRYKKYIAITDHNTIKGAMEAKKYDFENRIIIGEEIMTDNGEILAYNIIEEIKPGKIEDVLDKIHRQGGISILSHPFRAGYILKSKRKRAFNNEVMKLIDGVEVYNSRSSKRENQNALKIARQFNKIKTKGSDSHFFWELYLINLNLAPLNIFKNLVTIFVKIIKKVNLKDQIFFDSSFFSK